MPFESISVPHKRAFLEAYSITGSVKFAARHSKVKRANHYAWLDEAEYATAFKLAERMAGDALTDEAKRRAQFGVKDYVLYKGEVVKIEVVKDGKKKRVPLMRHKYSDAMLMFLLERLQPAFVEKREIIHATPEALKVEMNVAHTLDLTGLSEEELSTLERIASKVGTECSSPS